MHSTWFQPEITLVISTYQSEAAFKDLSGPSSCISCSLVLQSSENHRIFSSILSNALVKTIRIQINATQFIFIEASNGTLEIKVSMWRKRNQNWWHSLIWFSADWFETLDGSRMTVKNLRMTLLHDWMGLEKFTWIERLPFRLESSGIYWNKRVKADLPRNNFFCSFNFGAVFKENCNAKTSWLHMKERSKCWRTICISLESVKPFSSY